MKTVKAIQQRSKIMRGPDWCPGSAGPTSPSGERRREAPTCITLVIRGAHQKSNGIRLRVSPRIVVTAPIRRWLHALVMGCATAFGSAWSNVWGGGPSSSHRRAARHGFERLVDCLLKESVRTSPKTAFKGLSNWVRRVAVEDTLMGIETPPFLPPLTTCFAGELALAGFTFDVRKQVLHQLSRFARAGPLPVSSDVLLARRTHLEDLTAKFPVRRELRVWFRRFARSWTKRHQRESVATFPTSLSATYGSKVKDGGLIAAMKASVEAFKLRSYTSCIDSIRCVLADLPWGLDYSAPDAPCSKKQAIMVGESLFPWRDEYSYHHDVGPQEWETLVEHLYAYTAMAVELKEMMAAGDLPKIRQVVIQERGEKTRMVTPVSSPVVYISMYLNKLLLNLLKQDPRADPEDPTPMLSFARLVEGAWRSRDHVLRSVDMTRATDLMPFGVVSPIVEGILDEVAWSPFLKDALRYCTGPMQLSVELVPHPSHHQVTTCGGILMGLGTSWPILCLYNLGLIERAWTQTGYRRRTKEWERSRVRVVGDDLLGDVPKAVSDAYTSILAMTGGAPSAGKDLESSTCGVLVEEIIVMRARSPIRLSWNQHYTACHLKTGPIRPLLEGVPLERGAPPCPLWMMGPTMCRAINEFRDPEGVVKHLQDYYYRIYRSFVMQGVPPCLPREVGGPGMPGLPKDIRRAFRHLWPKWVRAVRCAMSQDSSTVLLSHLSSAWSATGQNLPSWEREFWITAAAEAVRSLGSVEDVDGRGPTPDQCAERALAMISNVRRLIGTQVPKEPIYKFSSVKRKLRRGIQVLNSLVPWPRLKGTAKDLGKGVHSYLVKTRKTLNPRALLPITHVTTVKFGPVQPYDPCGLFLVDF